MKRVSSNVPVFVQWTVFIKTDVPDSFI